MIQEARNAIDKLNGQQGPRGGPLRQRAHGTTKLEERNPNEAQKTIVIAIQLK